MNFDKCPGDTIFYITNLRFIATKIYSLKNMIDSEYLTKFYNTLETEVGAVLGSQ